MRHPRTGPHGAHAVGLPGVLLAMMILGGLAACAVRQADGCATEASDFAERAGAAVAEWEEAERAANAADIEALGPAIDRLSAIRQEVAGLDPPGCALDAKVGIVRFMDLTIEYQNGVWARDCQLCIEEIRVQAGAAKARALDELAELSGEE